MSTKTTVKKINQLHSLEIWRTSWVCYRSKFSQIGPWLIIFIILPIFISSLASWKESILQVKELQTLSSGATLIDVVNWSFEIAGAWARAHFVNYGLLCIGISFGYTMVSRIFLDYFLCERVPTRILVNQGLKNYLRLVLPTFFIGFFVLIFSSPILPIFMAALILLTYASVHAFYFSESSLNPFRFFTANLFLRYLNHTTVSKYDFFFMSFSTIGAGLIMFYGLESVLGFFKNFETQSVLNQIVLKKSDLGISYLAILIDALEAIGLGGILSYFAVVTTTAFFKSQKHEKNSQYI